MITLHERFSLITKDLDTRFVRAPLVEAKKWQSTKAPMAMRELFNISFTLGLMGSENLNEYREGIKPNLPWADVHFETERVSREPINPGESWKIWPYAQSAETFIDGGQYDHSYAERYWPKWAGLTGDGKLQNVNLDDFMITPNCRGVRFPIGDLDDLVDVLVDDPLTRQAYLPIFFPEDVMAAKMSKRVPCTLGYHFIRRDDFFHVVYPMRSCDYIRHFRDDVYLTARLLLWVLDECRKKDPENWNDVQPMSLRMHITSLHMFDLDRTNLCHRLGVQP